MGEEQATLAIARLALLAEDLRLRHLVSCTYMSIRVEVELEPSAVSTWEAHYRTSDSLELLLSSLDVYELQLSHARETKREIVDITGLFQQLACRLRIDGVAIDYVLQQALELVETGIEDG